MQTSGPFPIFRVLAASLAMGLLSGCSANFVPSSVAPEQVPIGNIQGSVHGGQSPVTGAQIYLFAAGTGGYGSGATSLITSGKAGVACNPGTGNSNPALNNACYVTTDNNGNFALTGDYTCTQGQDVYMVAVGGNPGLSPGSFVTGATFTSASSTITVVSSTWVVPGMTVSGTGVSGTVTAVNGTTVTLNQGTTGGSTENVMLSGSGSQVTTGATFSANSSTITVTSATGISTGMTISGSGVGGTVTRINGTTLTLSQNTAAASVGSVTFSVPPTTATFALGSNQVNVASATGISTGMTISGTGIGGTVTAVNGTTLTMSQNATANSPNTGANVSFGTPVNNTGIVQMAALAQCPTTGRDLSSKVSYLVINEVTTVAFAYSMSGFGVDAFDVSTGLSSLQTVPTDPKITAMNNAFANANNIVNLQWGQAPTTANNNSNSYNPQNKLYALASIVATCVNTSSAWSSQCTQLFGYAPNGTAVPTDEATALFNIAHNQGQNFANIWGMYPTTPVFVSQQTDNPAKSWTDWTMPVIYKGLVSLPSTSDTPPTYTSGPFSIAFDSSGYAWIGDRVNGVVEIEPQGKSTAVDINGAGTNFSMVKGVAVSPVDQSIWISDNKANKVWVMAPGGGSIGATPIAVPGGPIMTAFSTNTSTNPSQAYEANETNSTISLITGVSPYNLTSTTSVNVVDPGWIAVDQKGSAWIPSSQNTETGDLYQKENGNSGTYKWRGAVNGGAVYAYSLAIDSSGNIWLGDISGTNQVDEIAAGGTGVTNTLSTASGGVSGPYKLAIDGGNNVWICNSVNNATLHPPNPNGTGWPATVSAHTTLPATSTKWLSSTGFNTGAPIISTDGTTPLYPYCVVAAPDPSGNLWVANSDGSVSQLLGVATPTAAPLSGGAGPMNGGAAGNMGTMP